MTKSPDAGGTEDDALTGIPHAGRRTRGRILHVRRAGRQLILSAAVESYNMGRTDYQQFYEQMTGRIRESDAACFLLRTGGKAATGVMYAAYPALLVLIWISGDLRRLAWNLLIPAASFALLTVVRARINRPRPYEAWPIDPLIHKDTKGNSMPSRHVFSSAVIATAWLAFWLPAGIFLLAVTAAAAVIRVLGGVHYPSDVAAGFASGVAAGLLLMALCP